MNCESRYGGRNLEYSKSCVYSAVSGLMYHRWWSQESASFLWSMRNWTNSTPELQGDRQRTSSGYQLKPHPWSGGWGFFLYYYNRWITCICDSCMCLLWPQALPSGCSVWLVWERPEPSLGDYCTLQSKWTSPVILQLLDWFLPYIELSRRCPSALWEQGCCGGSLQVETKGGWTDSAT